MKKNTSIVLLLIVLVAIPVIIFSSYQHRYDPYNEVFPDLPKDEKWEYIKDRLFDGETSNVQKLNGPILFTLENATAEDSLMVENAIQKIRTIIPNKKIDFYENFIEKTPKELAKYLAQKRKGKAYIDDDFFKGYKYLDIIQSTINLGFNTDIRRVLAGDLPDYQYYPVGQLSTVVRKNPKSDYFSNIINAADIHFLIKKEDKVKYFVQELITAHILKSLCKIQNSRRKIKQVGSIYGLTSKHSFATIISENDKFLLNKLYASDFKEQFKIYLYKTYPWYYARNFYNKSKTRTYAIWTVVFLSVFFLVVGFNLSTRVYKNRYFNYLIPTTLLLMWVVNSINTYNFITSKSQVIVLSDYNQIYLIPLIVASLIALFLFLFDKYVITKKMNFSIELIFKTTFTFIIFMVPIVILSTTEIKNNNWYFLERVGLPILIIALGRGLLIYLNHFSENLVKEKDIELSRLKEINAQSELKLLQSHINPHFLYNSLNSIASLVHDDANKAEKMTLSLSDLFRYSINKKGKKMSTVTEEVALVENYLEIEKIRFGERLSFTLSIDNDTKEEEIPMFMLQPLIENAIKHGVSKIGGEAKISLDIKKNNNGLLIVVRDNGPDFPEGLVSGHGLQTVYDLLRLSYGKKASLRWENQPKKQIVISIQNK